MGETKFLSWFNRKHKVELEKNGDYPAKVGQKIHCVNPNHQDDTPSMHIYKHKAVCFGECEWHIEKKHVKPTKSSAKKKIELFYQELIAKAKQQDVSDWVESRKYNPVIVKKLGVGKITREVYDHLIHLFTIDFLKKIGIKAFKISFIAY